MHSHTTSGNAISFNALSADMEQFNNIHSMLTSLMDNMQQRFKQDTGYKHSLIAPQGNIIYALNATLAQHMIDYFSDIFVNRMHFSEDEFVFTRKSSHEGEGLQRIRLEFTKGITVEMIQKIALSIDTAKEYSN